MAPKKKPVPKSSSPKKGKSHIPTMQEMQMGLMGEIRGRALDYFTNMPARTGYGSPSVAQGVSYELVRFSYNYWALITLYRNHWISRRIVDQPVLDMIRTWPTLTGDIDPKDLVKVDRVIRRTQVKAKMAQAMKWARLFGGGGALMIIDGHDKILDKPLEPDDIEIGAFKGLIPFDRWSGIYPDGGVSTDVTRPVDFNLPEFYKCTLPDGNSFRVHSSRVLRFSGPEVPTPEYEAQSYWGISVLEPVFEEITKRDNMSWNILNLTFRANILGMKFPDLAQMLSGISIDKESAMKFQQRMSEINHLLSNQSLIPLPKDGSIEATQYTFAGLSDCYQQFQLDISGAAQIPVTRLWGRTITGLGQSNDADERIYEEKIASDEDSDMRPQLEKLFPVIFVSEFGESPENLDMNFPSVRVLDEKEKAELAKIIVDCVNVAVAGGFISPRAGAKELKQTSPVTGLFTNITDEDIEKLSDEVNVGGEFDMNGVFGPEKSEKKSVAEIAKAADEKVVDSDIIPVARRTIGDMELAIENRAGDIRAGKGWRTKMPADYGFIPGVMGADGDSLDCYVGDGVGNGWVYVIDQARLDNPKKFDEHKCMINFQSMQHAVNTYHLGHHRSKDVYLDVTPMPLESFKSWIRTGDMRRPCAEQNP